MHLFCFGFGFTARALATRVAKRGWRVTGTTRDGAMAGSVLPDVELISFDGDQPIPGLSAHLAGVTHLLMSIPPGTAGDPVLRWHGDDVAAIAGALEWAGYLSTTGVYGDHDGALVSEAAPLTPTLERSRNRVIAEQGWLKLHQAHRLPLHIFRLAGIYGPGRNALQQVLSGEARRVIKPAQVFSRIHVDDAAAVLDASIARPSPGTVYNVCDDEAAPPQDVIAFAAELLERAPPPEVPFAKAGLSDMAKSFYRDNKRVDNTRIKRDLGVKFTYPTYREGLTALARDL